MVRSLWKRAVAVALMSAGIGVSLTWLSWGQSPSAPADAIFQLDVDGANASCRVKHTWKTKDGTTNQIVENVKTGEFMTLVPDGPAGSTLDGVPLKILHWGTSRVPPAGSPMPPGVVFDTRQTVKTPAPIFTMNIEGQETPCRVKHSWMSAERKAHQIVENVKTGELMTLTPDGPAGTGLDDAPLQIVHWGSSRVPPVGTPIPPGVVFDTASATPQVKTVAPPPMLMAQAPPPSFRPIPQSSSTPVVMLPTAKSEAPPMFVPRMPIPNAAPPAPAQIYVPPPQIIDVGEPKGGPPPVLPKITQPLMAQPGPEVTFIPPAPTPQPETIYIQTQLSPVMLPRHGTAPTAPIQLVEGKLPGMPGSLSSAPAPLQISTPMEPPLQRLSTQPSGSTPPMPLATVSPAPVFPPTMPSNCEVCVRNDTGERIPCEPEMGTQPGGSIGSGAPKQHAALLNRIFDHRGQASQHQPTSTMPTEPPPPSVAMGTKQPWPIGANSAVAAYGGLGGKVAFIPVPIATVPHPLRAPQPPMQIPQAPQPNTMPNQNLINAFTVPSPSPTGPSPALNAFTPPMSPEQMQAMAMMMQRGPMPGYGQMPMQMPGYGMMQPPPAGYGMMQPPMPGYGMMPMQPTGAGPMPMPAPLPIQPASYSTQAPTFNNAMERRIPAAAKMAAYGPAGAQYLGQYLKVLSESASPGEREWAANSLAGFDPQQTPQAVQALTHAGQKDPASSVRAACVNNLCRMNLGREYTTKLLQFFRQDGDPRVRQEVDYACNRLGIAK